MYIVIFTPPVRSSETNGTLVVGLELEIFVSAVPSLTKDTI